MVRTVLSQAPRKSWPVDPFKDNNKGQVPNGDSTVSWETQTGLFAPC